MARVWLAVSSGANGFRKLVVVKQLRSEMFGNERARRMFLDEARLAAKLNHPNTVQTLEVAEQGDELFIVMEYLDGQALDAIQRQGPVPLEALVAVLTEVSAGLHHAHELRDLDGTELGVVHCDVSPQNVFVTYTGHVKVVDFGIATVAGSSSESEPGVVKGKLNYMAPEQALGQAVDRRADIFSLGVMLYSALSGGRRLWEGLSDNEILERLKEGNIPRLVPRPAGLNVPPPELVGLCNRCLAARPGERFATALELQSALEDYAETSGGVLSRRELGAFLSRSFESQRARRRAVIEEKVKALSDGALISDSVKRARSVLPDEQVRPSRPTTGAGITSPPPNRPSSGELKAAVAVASEAPLPLTTAARASSASNLAAASGQHSSRPAGGAWRMPEPYKLVARLGHPGLIFEAKNRTTRRGVTVQLLKGALAPEQLHARYSRAARLRHPNTVRLLDVGSVKQPVPVTYVVRENVRGRSLQQLVTEDGALPVWRAFRICMDVLKSLRDAHEHDLVHGRLRPDHILVEAHEAPAGEVARVLGYWPSNAAVRREEEEVFCAPEQLGGESTVSGDLFAVGATLCYCLFGGPVSLVSPPSTGRADVDDLLRTALATEAKFRFPNAEAMLKAMQGLDWAAELEQFCRDRYVLGLTSECSRVRLLPARNEMLSTRPVTIWVMDGDPSFELPVMTDALAELSSNFEVRRLGEADRELAIEELTSGRITPPWVVLFGGIHVLVEEPLLKVLATSAEVSRMLLLGGSSYELLQKTINDVGLDHYLCAPQSAEHIVESITKLIARTRRLTSHYDAVRSELRRSRDELSRRSRELAAADGAASR